MLLLITLVRPIYHWPLWRPNTLQGNLGLRRFRPQIYYIYGLNTNLQLEIPGVVLGSIDYKPTLLPIIMLLKQLAMNTLHSTEHTTLHSLVFLSLFIPFFEWAHNEGIFYMSVGTCTYEMQVAHSVWATVPCIKFHVKGVTHLL